VRSRATTEELAYSCAQERQLNGERMLRREQATLRGPARRTARLFRPTGCIACFLRALSV
jgi:hypothetical protein